MTAIAFRNSISALLLLAAGCVDRPPSERRVAAETTLGTELDTTCEIIVDELGILGIVASSEGGDDSCRVNGEISAALLPNGIDPLETLRTNMVANGWMVDIESIADGPGMSSFRMISDVRSCQINGGAPAWIDDDAGIRQSDEYFVEVACEAAD